MLCNPSSIGGHEWHEEPADLYYVSHLQFIPDMQMHNTKW